MKFLRFLIPLLALAACPPVVTPIDVCSPNPCSGDRSVCTSVNESPVCSCREGFQDIAGVCVRPGACEVNPCTEANRTVCVVSGQTAICRCDSGFSENAQGLCVRAQSCEPNPCSQPGKSVCAENNGAVTCSCDDGLRDDGMGGCVSENPCADNPCTQPNRGVCVAQGMTAICQCDSGFVDDGSGTCVRPASCNPNPCTSMNRTQCSDSSGVVVCSCDSGYRLDAAGQCVPMQACNPNPCTQANRGVCTENNGVAICGCNAGYRDQGGTCVVDDACDPNPCMQPNRGVCTASNGTAVCGCNAGFQDQNGTCVVADVCAPNPCTQPNRGVCSALNGAAACGCNNGFRDENGACVAIDACNPNPCAQPNRNVCTSGADAGVSCACNAGYQEGANGCEVIPPATCSTQHNTGDSYEPDECPALAKPIVPGVPQQHTYAPAGDVDWVYFSADAGTVVLATETGTVPSLLSLYGSNGSAAIATNQLNRLHLKVAADGTYFLQVRPQTASAMGATTIGVTFTTDDHADSVAGAPTLVTAIPNPGTIINGKFDFPRDVDCLSVPVQANRVYQFDETTNLDIQLTVFTATGTYLPKTDSEWVRFKTSVAETLTVCVEAKSATSIDPWTMRISDSGVDDHADSRDGSPATLTPTNTLNGKFDFTGDTDCLAVPVQANRIYTFEETTPVDVVNTIFTATGVHTAATDSESIRFRATTNETLFFCTRASSATNIIEWTLRVTDQGVDDHANSRSESPATLMPGSSVTGQFNYAGDIDCLAVPVQANRIYSFAETSSTDVYTAIYTATETFIANSDDESHRFRTTAADTLFFCTRAYSSSSTASWTLRVLDEGVDDFVNSRDLSPTTLAPGASVSGQFQYPIDIECFAVPVQANRIYTFAETTSADVLLTVYTATSTYIAQTDSESVRFKSLTTETLFLCTRAYSSSSLAEWTLRVTDEGVDDHVNSRSDNPATLLPGSSISGTFDYAGDIDCLAVPVIANHGYTFEETTSIDVMHTIYTATTTFISSTDAEAVHFRAPNTETLFLCTRAYSAATGAWTLRVVDRGADDHSDERAGATPLTIGGPAVNGALQYSGDWDYFSFTTTGPVALRVITTGVTTAVRVENSSGVSFGTGTGPNTFTVTTTTAGTYFVRISPGSIGTYTVAVAN